MSNKRNRALQLGKQYITPPMFPSICQTAIMELLIGQEKVIIGHHQLAIIVGTTLPNVAGSPFRISGGHPETQAWGGSMDGVIDEVRLYNRALDADEIKDTMESADGEAVTSKGKLSTTWAELKS